MKPLVACYATRGIAYEKSAEECARSAREAGYEARIQLIEEQGSWARNTSAKPGVILEVMESNPGRPLLFLDADARVKQPIPLLERIPTDWRAPFMACQRFPDQIKPGMEAMRYLPWAWKNGRMLLSGVLYIPHNFYVLKFLRLWEKMCNMYPEVWDQVLMADALNATAHTSDVNFRPFPSAMNPGGPYIGHDSAFHKIWKCKTPRKILILGSGPGIDEWVRKHLREYINRGFWVVAVNNAWLVVEREMNIWLHSTDFDYKNGRPEGDWFLENPDWQCITPYWVPPPTRILMLDVLLHFLNLSIRDHRPLEVHVAGSDFVYDEEGPTHFYGAGGLDPLRFGDDELQRGLKLVATYYAFAGAKLYNASDRRRTRLPFPRERDDGDATGELARCRCGHPAGHHADDGCWDLKCDCREYEADPEDEGGPRFRAG